MEDRQSDRERKRASAAKGRGRHAYSSRHVRLAVERATAGAAGKPAAGSEKGKGR